MSTNTTEPAVTARLVELMRSVPSRTGSYRAERVEWLMDVATTLDGLNVDGAADLATKARTEALALVDRAVQGASGAST